MDYKPLDREIEEDAEVAAEMFDSLRKDLIVFLYGRVPADIKVAQFEKVVVGIEKWIHDLWDGKCDI